MSSSSAFLLLDERIQRFLWLEQWEALRDVQELAIPLIIPGDRDVIVAAATAAGKTEAAFLPALTHLLQRAPDGLIIYVSPLKALINDQFGRLGRLCEALDIPVWPWHGDISSSLKTRFMRKPSGVLLITPESLEALFCNRGTSIVGTFKNAAFVVVDELHAFIGTERGKQLQSLLHRLEAMLGRVVPRVGLSATLGDMALAAQYLRSDRAVARVEAGTAGTVLQALVKGYQEPTTSETPTEPEDGVAAKAVAQYLFAALRGSNNLVFPNSRREVERYTHLLNEYCDDAKVPHEFWPHHGSLSREIRADTEAALKRKDGPATAICTSTLELGIDIGAVKSVAQVGPPPSVASLRQRLGRSGRRKGESAILRGFLIENALNADSPLNTQLRINTVHTAAAIGLLLEGWFEPPAAHGAHLSTLVQQLLSAIAQYGGLRANDAYALFCGATAPFSEVTTAQFVELLRHLGKEDVLQQDGSGLLLHGPVGDRLVNHYTFYAAFMSDEEFRVITGGKTLGTLPVHQMLVVGQRILFAGRTWLVDAVNEQEKTIAVSPARGGAPPLFNGGAGRTHTRLRQRMREIYSSTVTLPFLDPAAQQFIEEGRATFARLGLADRWLIDQGDYCFVVTWQGDATNEALACLLMAQGWHAFPTRLGVEVLKGGQTTAAVANAISTMASEVSPPLDVLLAKARNLQRQKWDWLLPVNLLHVTYASLNLDLTEAKAWLSNTFPQEAGIAPIAPSESS